LKGLFSQWFLKPTCGLSLKLGSMNETHILSKLKAFFNIHASRLPSLPVKLFWETHSEFGLLGNKNEPALATSVDAFGIMKMVAHVQSDAHPAVPTEYHFVPVELKTVTNHKTLEQAQKHANEIGTFAYCNTTSTANWHNMVKDVHHRAQILHHAAVTQCPFVLYVVSSLGAEGIVRMVLVHFTVNILAQYNALLTGVKDSKFLWAYTNIPPPEFSANVLGYCENNHIFKQ
jgi:hypothetical protein